SLPGKFRNRLVNSPLTGRSSNRTTISKREESQEKECQESYANTAHPQKRAKFLSRTAGNDLSRSDIECRSPCPQANRPGHRDVARRPGPAITRVASGGHAVRRASCKGGEDFLDRLELVSIGRGRHEDRRRDAGVAPRRDPSRTRAAGPNSVASASQRSLIRLGMSASRFSAMAVSIAVISSI